MSTSPTSPSSPRIRAHSVGVALPALRPREPVQGGSGSSRLKTQRPRAKSIAEEPRGTGLSEGESSSGAGGGQDEGRDGLGGMDGPHTGESSTKGRRASVSSARRRSVSRSRARSRSLSLSRSRSQGEERPGSPVELEIEDRAGQHTDLDDGVVGVLDCIDPQVATVNHLQNVTNSILIPHLPALWNRRPQVVLSSSPVDEESGHPHSSFARGADSDDIPLAAQSSDLNNNNNNPTSAASQRHRSSTVSRLYAATAPPSDQDLKPSRVPSRTPSDLSREINTIEAESQLDSHVRHVLSSDKKAQLRRMLAGLWVFLKTPMGIVTAIYGFLVVFWGAAIVLFLAGWINAGSKEWQDIWVEITCQIVNGLFTITGVGLIPWRAMDTYRMSVIWTLKKRTERLRKKRGLPPIEDPNDIPDPQEAKDYVSVLTEKDQERLRYQQEMFSKSQTWYRPHATDTHKAFPMAWALWNTILMDGNSAFQCMLCGCMWGLNRHTRPAWTTGSLIPLSFCCGIAAGVLIWQGSARTKKRITVEDRLREALNIPLAIGIGIPGGPDALAGDKVGPGVEARHMAGTTSAGSAAGSDYGNGSSSSRSAGAEDGKPEESRRSREENSMNGGLFHDKGRVDGEGEGQGEKWMEMQERPGGEAGVMVRSVDEVANGTGHGEINEEVVLGKVIN